MKRLAQFFSSYQILFEHSSSSSSRCFAMELLLYLLAIAMSIFGVNIVIAMVASTPTNRDGILNRREAN
jgi:hypothetical protein